jgi:DNA-binding XRE family transcriptional regulator
MSKQNLNSIAKNIKKYRAKMFISQNKLSKLAGITLHTITKIESWAMPNPTIKTMVKIARVKCFN